MSRDQTAASSNVVGIHKRAMLVTAIFRYKGWTKADPAFKSIIAAQTGANPDRLSGSKKLIESDFPELKRLREIKNAAYKHHKENTLPWDNWARRLLPSDKYLDYTQAQRQFKADYETACKSFAARIADIKADAQANLGSAYDEADFDDLNRIDELYLIDHEFETLPDSDRWLDMAGAERNKLVRETEERLQQRVNGAVNDIKERIESAVAKLHERLEGYDAKDRDTRKKWDDAWIDNVRSIVDAIPSLNFTDDPELKQIARQLKGTVLRFEKDELKSNPGARKEAAASAQDVMKKMAMFGTPAA